MNENKYEVWDGNIMIAGNMDLQTALILTEALFNKYFNERIIGYEIRREYNYEEE